jgi:hypothetical protein
MLHKNQHPAARSANATRQTAPRPRCTLRHLDHRPTPSPLSSQPQAHHILSCHLDRRPTISSLVISTGGRRPQWRDLAANQPCRHAHPTPLDRFLTVPAAPSARTCSLQDGSSNHAWTVIPAPAAIQASRLALRLARTAQRGRTAFGRNQRMAHTKPQRSPRRAQPRIAESADCADSRRLFPLESVKSV